MKARLLASVSAMLLAAATQSLAQTAGPAPTPYVTTFDRRDLPAPRPAYQGVLAPTLSTSSPAAFPPKLQAPANAPNVLVIMTDDTGFGAGSPFGGPIPLPAMAALAAHGLKYNEFHTTSLCSPTRAALLTGRNHHSVGFGVISELSTGYPGYDGIIPKSAATFGRVLKDNGYATAWFGKNHNTPTHEITPVGPYDLWPSGFGFDKFYGFMGGETNQWAPELFEDHQSVEPPANDPTYLLDRDMADHAITWLHQQRTEQPGKPFLMYYAPGTSHAPLDAPKSWIDRFNGKFDQGWDKMREETFAREKEQGVIPADAVLTPRPPEIPAWDSLTPVQKKLAAHMMEVYAGALAYCDDQIGRVVQSLKASGQFDNTLILYIEGDNGASGEGGLMGTTDASNVLNGIKQTDQEMLTKYDQMGGPYTEMHYPVGWAWAMNSPFQWMKQIASHLGGTRNGLVVSWPARIHAHGEVRSQFASVIDVAPTLYEAIGIPAPAEVDGVKQMPIQGTSFAYTFDHPDAPNRHTTQYFEMLGNRAIYKDGWMASTHPEKLPWEKGMAGSPESYKWELYDLNNDYSQSKDLAASDPAKLTEMKAAFDVEARKYNVYPIDTRGALRLLGTFALRDAAPDGHYTFYPSPTRYEAGAWPSLVDRSWTATAQVVAPATGGDGMIFTEGGRFSGYGLFVLKGTPTFVYHLSNVPGDMVRLTGPKLSPGTHALKVDFNYSGGLGGPADVAFSVDGKAAGEGHLAKTLPFFISTEGAAVGHDTGTPLLEEYKLPFVYGGVVVRVDFQLQPAALMSAPQKAAVRQAKIAGE